MRPERLDHIALHVHDRDELCVFLTTELDLHVIDEGDDRTIIGATTDSGTIHLLDAPGASPESSRLIGITLAEPDTYHRDPLMTPEDLAISFVPVEDGARHRLIGVTLRSEAPVEAARAWVDEFGCAAQSAHPNVATVRVGPATITLVRETPREVATPLLAHVGLQVADAGAVRDEASDRGMTILDIVDAPDSTTISLAGPDGVPVALTQRKIIPRAVLAGSGV